ncbi:MAG: prepilin-type N-terminal cleavage/methylation domain-containing protein, partial [Candidatus Omnitrophica bacterium]|nr:prepilin-type N-terminal cleavage/methylation domain-containing protein [Candidatus Omnitrophota bacterium]
RNAVNRKAFTLVEILIAMSIMLMITAMVASIFVGVLNYWKRGHSSTQRQQSTRLVFSRMTGSISSLFVATSRGIYCFGSKDKFYFISASARSSEGDLAEMGYEYNAAEQKIFFSRQDKADFNFDTYDSKDMIAIHVLSLDFRYMDSSGNWLESWDSRQGGAQQGTPPQAIKISLGAENTDYPDNKEIFETTIELPIRTKY